MLYMKGVPEAPQCGFSNMVCQILKIEGVEEFDSYNVRGPAAPAAICRGSWAVPVPGRSD